MSLFARFFGAARYVALTRLSPRDRKADRPASFAEIVAASAFVDFGGISSGDWLHAWETSTATNRRPADDGRPAASAIPQWTIEDERDSDYRDDEKTISRRRQYATYAFADCEPSLFYSRDGDSMFRGQQSAMLDLAMCVGAFCFVAVILLFVHPSAPKGRTTDSSLREVAAEASQKAGDALVTSDMKIRLAK
jgi:hypothetical protein